MTVLQYRMLTRFAHQTFTPETALDLKQTTFGSLCHRHWVGFDAYRGVFHISAEGNELFHSYANANCLLRKTNNGRFSQWVPSRTRAALRRVS